MNRRDAIGSIVGIPFVAIGAKLPAAAPNPWQPFFDYALEAERYLARRPGLSDLLRDAKARGEIK